MDRYIDIANDIYKVKKFKESAKCKKGYAYIKGDYAFPYRGKYKKNRPLKVGIYMLSDGTYKFIKAMKTKKMKKYHISKLYKIDPEAVKEILNMEGVISKDMDIIMGETNEVFTPIISKDDNALQRLIKEALMEKKIDIKNYAGRFRDPGDMSNHKRALLHHGKMSLEKFLKWLYVLDLDYEIIIRDKEGAINPMEKEIRGH